MKYFTKLISLLLMVSTTISGFAMPVDNAQSLNPAAGGAALELASRGLDWGVCLALAIAIRRVDRAHQTNFNWILEGRGTAGWYANNRVHVRINGEAADLNGHLILVEITNNSQRYGNAVLLSRYADNTNRGRILNQIRIPIGTADAQPASVAQCVQLPTLDGSWWWQLEN